MEARRWRSIGSSASGCSKRLGRFRRRAMDRGGSGGGEVLFPPDGRGMVAVDTLTGASPGPATGMRIAILHANSGSGHKRAAQAIAAAVSRLSPDTTVREVDTLVFASRFYRGT